MAISTFIPATEYRPPYYRDMDMTGEIVGGWEILGYAGARVSPGSGPSPIFTVSCIYCGLYTTRYSNSIRVAIHGCRHCSEKYHSGNRHSSWKGSGVITGDFMHDIRSGARRKSRTLEVSIDVKFLDDLWASQDGRCAYTGIQLVMGTAKGNIETTASLDRIDSSLGYVEGNVQFVHKMVNKMKWDHSHNDFLMWVNLISNHTKEKSEIL
jgi:hypothetical protein